jgi:murein DD-endopeptidase MepM/ murein hydrolase activator NlpD
VDFSTYKPHLMLVIGVMLATAACSSRPASSARSYRSSIGSGPLPTHTVAAGETVYHIALEYGISPQRLMQANGVSDPRDLRVGQVLVIPDRSAGFATASLASPSDSTDRWAIPPPADRQFAWPVASGTVSSPFGIRNGVMHEGVDIAAPAGTPVNAADSGVVIYSGHLRGYGNVVILQHTDSYVTVYGHNRTNLVRAGDRVTRGQEIAELGSSGRASAPNLHFEVRCENRPENPLAYLPLPEPSNGIRFASFSGD